MMMMAKAKTTYICSACDYRSPVALGRCPECGTWGSLSAHTEAPPAPSGTPITANALPALLRDTPKAIPLAGVTGPQGDRFSTGYTEFDRVLGGGLIPGAYVLVGGDPGIGKSTLMLQTAARVAQQGRKVLYVAGEESAHQIRLRADRLGLGDTSPIQLLTEISLPEIVTEIRLQQPHLVIIDSVQAVYDPQVASPPGSTTQIRAVANQLMGLVKTLNVATLLVGHVTKEGQLSGPKLLEHTVDTVLYFEGEKYKDLRLLRGAKNRFGNTSEIGVFEMAEEGLREITNPSELFLSERLQHPLPGCVTICTLEGTRPLLVELQALVGQSTYASPRRVVNGVETNRLHQIVAVLERRLGLDFSHQDLYVNVVGGLRVDEPAADLGIAMALVTNLRNLSLAPGTVVMGEIGLTGEIRPVRRWRERALEAEKIGFRRVVMPAAREEGPSSAPSTTGCHLLPVATLMEAVTVCLDPRVELSV